MTRDAFKQVQSEIKDIELAVLGLVAITFSDFLSRDFVAVLVKQLRTLDSKVAGLSAAKVIAEAELDKFADEAADLAFNKIEYEVKRRALRYAEVLNRSMKQPLSKSQLKQLVGKVVSKLVQGDIRIAIPRPMTESRAKTLALPKAERERIEREYLEAIQNEDTYREVVAIKKMESTDGMREKYRKYARAFITSAILEVLGSLARRRKMMGKMTEGEINQWLTTQFASKFQNVFAKTSRDHRKLTLPDKARSIASFTTARLINELNRELIIASGAKYAYYRTQRDEHVCDKCATLENTVNEDVAEEVKDKGINPVGLYRVSDVRLREQHPVPRLRCYFVPVYV